MTGLSALTLLRAYREAGYRRDVLCDEIDGLLGQSRTGKREKELSRRRRQAHRFEAALIEKLQRPSCETCKWARALDNDCARMADGYVWCLESGDYAHPSKTDGVCLWEAK